MSLTKVVLLIQYSNEKFGFMKMNLDFNLTNLKMPIFFTAPNQVVLQDIKKFFQEARFDAKMY